MTLTPLDIHNKEFHTKLRGYDKDEVNEFLDQIIKDYELTLREKDHIQEELTQAQERLKYFNDLKDSLNQSIIVAQEAADRVKSNSQREAEITNREAQKQGQDIIDQANEKARHIIEEASKKAKRLAVETDDLKKQARIFRQKLQVMLDSQLEVVKGSEWDEILKQGDTSSYEEIQAAIRREDTLDNQAAKEVQSVANEDSNESVTADSQVAEPETVVVFPSDEPVQGKHAYPDDEGAADGVENNN